MNNASKNSPASDAIEQAAAAWVLRRDRGLTAAEQDEFSQWLATDPRHRQAVALHRWGWEELDRLAGLQSSLTTPDPDLLAPSRPMRLGRRRPALAVSTALALAATIAVVFTVLRPEPVAMPEPVQSKIATTLAAPCEQRTLDDGSVVELNRGAVLTVQFTEAERRVRLERGEANFTVAKHQRRPFIVSADRVEVRAVGTAFNVRLDPGALEVLVTEGQVSVEPAAVKTDAARGATAAVLMAGERTVVSLAPSAPAAQVVPVTPAELDARLAWRPRLLDFTNAPLTDIVAEFNRRNPVRLTVADDRLSEFRLSASIRSDNLEGFVRLMESDFGLKAEWRSETEIALRRDVAPASSR